MLEMLIDRLETGISLLDLAPMLRRDVASPTSVSTFQLLFKRWCLLGLFDQLAAPAQVQVWKGLPSCSKAHSCAKDLMETELI